MVLVLPGARTSFVKAALKGTNGKASQLSWCCLLAFPFDQCSESARPLPPAQHGHLATACDHP